MENNFSKLSAIDRVDNRRWMMIENALAQNNYFDCDVIQYNADRLRDAEVKAVIEGIGKDLIGAVAYRGGKILRLKCLLQEIKDISLL